MQSLSQVCQQQILPAKYANWLCASVLFVVATFFFVYNLKIILPFRLSTDIWCLYWLRKHSHSFTYMYDATSAVCFERYVIFSNRIELWLVKKYRTIKYFHWKPKETHVSHSIACLLADWLFAVSCPVVGSGLCGTRSILTKINK